MSRLTDAEVLQLQMAALDYVQANATAELVAVVDHIVADRILTVEARHDALVAAVEALADRWETDEPVTPAQALTARALNFCAHQLRAILAEHGRQA
ncbi:MAG TPA: hypothetical protein VFJ14_06800 [Nocardioidaceae bacterium]|nr:hypothetical protein [Nocardioidaceae bacterium]